MNSRRALSAGRLVGVRLNLCAGLPGGRKGDAQGQAGRADPRSGVPQIMTLEGKFVRVAYNNEGYVIIGYQATNRSVGEEWMLLEVGMTMLGKAPEYRMTRDALSLETPDGKTMPLPSIIEQREGNPSAIQKRAKVQRDSINYFPSSAYRACAHRLLPRPGVARAAAGRGRSEHRPRLCRPALFPDPRRDRLRPALAQREVPEQPRARAVPDPDRGRGEDPLEELQEHQKQVKDAFKPKK